MKTDDSKTISLFDKLGNQPAKLSTKMVFGNILKRFWRCANIFTPTLLTRF